MRVLSRSSGQPRPARRWGTAGYAWRKLVSPLTNRLTVHILQLNATRHSRCASGTDGACCLPRVQEAQRLQKWALFEQREAVRLQAKEEKAAAREAAKEERLARKAAERAAKQAALQQKKDLTRKCASPAAAARQAAAGWPTIDCGEMVVDGCRTRYSL